MLFSSPDYPLFLIAVFFVYALSRRSAWGRVVLMVLLGDLVFMLVAKDPDALWDPLGGMLYRLAAGEGHGSFDCPIAALATRWAIGLCVLGGAIAGGRRAAGWIASDHGQRIVARGIVVALIVVAATVAIASQADVLDAVTAAIASHGHLLVLLVLGVGIGAAQNDAHRPLGRVIVLFVASSLFYQAWAAAMPGPYRYLLGLLLVTISLDYYLAIWIEGTEDPLARKALVIASLVSNLGILFFFKYTNFVAQDVLHLPVRPLHLILPAGISFHTFQSLSYTIDVYRKRLRATRSVIQFATFVLFFPQLVAGPIVRAQDLLPQLAELPALELEKATQGLFRIAVGLFKKIALADTLALSIVERVFEAPERFSGLEVLAGVFGYALQIYLDFSAYSDIAIGSAQVLGFTLPENFRTPYRSANLQEFWRRWHISLSTWLRDYLYVTLGGNRGAPWRTYGNLIVTMVLGGLWHGASWTFIVWGALHGFGLAVTRFFQRARSQTGSPVHSLFLWCGAVAFVGLAIAGFVMPPMASTWSRLLFGWLCLTPLWALLTVWLSGDHSHESRPPILRFSEALRSARTRVVEGLRLLMCASGIGLVVAIGALQHWTRIAFAIAPVSRAFPNSLQPLPDWTWIPFAIAMWGFGWVADVIERGNRRDGVRLLKRGISAFLVFQYVCLAWVFFRATSFDNALAVLRQIAGFELDHANLVPMVTLALVVGFLCHFFADGSFRWLRERFVAMPAWGQGLVLAAAALVLRELAHPKIVPFIYFQF
jgi:D-alanyl-lipoteichoic acid acyltransferase DltB (MBOAT superfamily)